MKKATIYEYARMCSYYDDCNWCEGCPLASENNGLGIECCEAIINHPDKANEIILKWCKEHPVKTRQSEFLKMFPNVELVDDVVINICPNVIDGQYSADCTRLTCKECRKEYWLAEVDE